MSLIKLSKSDIRMIVSSAVKITLALAVILAMRYTHSAWFLLGLVPIALYDLVADD